MFDVVIKYPWYTFFGLFGGVPHYYLVRYNDVGYSIIDEYPTLEEADLAAEGFN